MREVAHLPTTGNPAVVTLVGIFLFSVSILPSRAASYSADPASGEFKDVGVGYRFRVSGIVGGTVTFEVLPKSGTFGSSGRAVIKRDSTTGTVVGTGTFYAPGAPTAGTISVNLELAGLTSGSADFYVVRDGDTNVWDGPISITMNGSNVSPSVSVASAVMQNNGDLVVTWTASDDLTASIGTDLYLSVNGDLGSFNFSSKQTAPDSVNGQATSFTYPAGFLATLGMIPGGSYRVRANVFDGGSPQLTDQGFSPSFVYTFPAAPDRPTISPGGPTRFTSGRSRIVLVGTTTDANEVRFNVGGGAFRRASGVVNWKVPVRLEGKRTVTKVRATGPGGSSPTLVYSIMRR
ncbi:MAG: hypothetical protein JNJ70_06440 [Verrucomicrobiales bacterium]|nr:hypothetical protein [Verrucomicrobiales bacterium]